MTFFRLIKDHIAEVFSFFLLSLEFFFLNPNRFFGIVSFLLSAILCFFILKREDRQRKETEKKMASLSFLYDFLTSLTLENSCEKSYEHACQYLVGYQENHPYEEVISNPDLIQIDSFQEEFREILLSEQSSEVHLPDYLPLQDEIEKRLQNYSIRLNDCQMKKRKALCFLLCLFLFVLLFLVADKNVASAIKSNTFSLLSCFVLPFCYPSYLYFLNKEAFC